MQAIKKNYEKILLGVLLLAFVGSGFYWLAYLGNVGELARSGDLIGFQTLDKRLEALADDHFTAIAKLDSPELIWGRLDGVFTGDLFKGRSYMQCANPECNFWLAFGVKACAHCGADQGEGDAEIVSTTEDRDGDGIPDRIEMMYDFLDPDRKSDGWRDESGNWFFNREVFLYYYSLDPEHDGSSMADPAMRPPLATRLRLVNVDRDLFGIMLDTVMSVPDQDKETWDISLRVRENGIWRSRFVRIGQTVAGYTVVDVEEKFVSEYDPAVRSEIRRDVSTLTLQRGDEEPIVLSRRERKHTGIVVDMVLEISPTKARPIRGVRAGDTLELTDAIGQIERYKIESYGNTIKAILLDNGEPAGPEFIIDRTPKIVIPRDVAVPGAMGADRGMPFPGTDMRFDMMDYMMAPPMDF